MEDRTVEVEQINIIPAFNEEKMKQIEQDMEEFLQTLQSAGQLKDSDDFETLSVMLLEIPRKLHTLTRTHYYASKKLGTLRNNLDKMEVILSRTIRTRYNEVMDGKAQKKAFLTVDHYEFQLIEYNRQKDFIDYIDNMVEQFRYLNNNIKSRIEFARLKRELGY